MNYRTRENMKDTLEYEGWTKEEIEEMSDYDLKVQYMFIMKKKEYWEGQKDE